MHKEKSDIDGAKSAQITITTKSILQAFLQIMIMNSKKAIHVICFNHLVIMFKVYYWYDQKTGILFNSSPVFSKLTYPN